MKLGTTYICVSDMEKSLNFYRALLQQEPAFANDDRWVTFDCGNMLSLYNRRYDEALLENHGQVHFNKAYLEIFQQETERTKNNQVIFNFEVSDLREEYARICALSIREVSPLLYVNVHAPYWYFNVLDPDGNILEITGPYHPEKEEGS